MKSTSKKPSNKPKATTQAPQAAEQENALNKNLETKLDNTVQEKQTPQPASDNHNDVVADKVQAQANPAKDAQLQKEEKPAKPETKTPPQPAVKSAETTKTPAEKPTLANLGAKLLTVFALLLAGGAVTFSAYLWQQMNQLEQRLQAGTGIESEATQAARTAGQQAQALTDKIDNVQRKLDSLQTEFEAINQGDKQADLIADLYNNPKTDMLPLSINSLLASAELHVTLSNSVHPLLTTLTSIDNHLKANGMDDDNMLRQAIKADIEGIRNHPTSDPITMAEKINTLIHQINQDSTLLSARTRTITPPPEANISIDVDLSDAPTAAQPSADNSTWDTIKNTSGWIADKASEISSATWDQLGSLVQVTPLNSDNQQVILSPNESSVLRENIKLRLISARITILQRQYEQANKEILDIYKTIETYFDNQKALPLLQRLNNLSAELKNTTFPQPTHTLAALKTLQSNQ